MLIRSGRTHFSRNSLALAFLISLSFFVFLNSSNLVVRPNVLGKLPPWRGGPRLPSTSLLSSPPPSHSDRIETTDINVIHADTKPKFPGFCDRCGPEDLLCKKYGDGNLARSRSYEGPNARLKRVIRKAQTGAKIKIGVLGGSVTHGHGVNDEHRWPTLYGQWWRKIFPENEIVAINGAVPAMETSYYQVCFREHIDEDVDVVVIEMAINDRRMEELAISYEWLLRELLELPNKPAVINLHVLALSFNMISTGGDLHTPIANYYDTPIISVRNMLLPHILNSPPRPLHIQNPPESTSDNFWSDASIEHFWFTCYDRVDFKGVDLRHLNANGHRLMSELLESFSERVLCDVLREDAAKRMTRWRPEDHRFPGEEILEYIPRVRIFDKYERDTVIPPVKSSCRTVTSTKNPLVYSEAQGWSLWSHELRPDKIYFRTNTPGSRISFEVETFNVGEVHITYLKSKTFGMGTCWCWIDDARESGVGIDGWWDYDGLNLAGGALVGSKLSPGHHILHCELLEETKDQNGGHDFRITAVDTS